MFLSFRCSKNAANEVELEQNQEIFLVSNRKTLINVLVSWEAFSGVKFLFIDEAGSIGIYCECRRFSKRENIHFMNFHHIFLKHVDSEKKNFFPQIFPIYSGRCGN